MACPRALLSLVLIATMLATVGVAIAQPAPAAAQASEFPTSAVVPEDALAYIVFTLDDKSDQWKLGKELLDRAGLGAALAQASDEALTDAAGNALPMDAFLGGEAALVVTGAALEQAVAASEEVASGGLLESEATPESGPAAATEKGAALVLDARAPDTAFAGIQSSMRDQATEAGTTVASSDYEGVTIESVAGSGDDSPMAVARVDDHILIAGSPADLEPLIDTSQGKTKPLSDLAAFKDVRSALNQDHLLFGFFNGAAAGDAESALGGLGPMAGSFGATDRYTGLLIRADDPGFRMETVAIPAEGATLPPAAKNADSELLTHTPGDAAFFLSAFDLGKTGFLDALGAAFLGMMTSQMGSVSTPAPNQTPEEFIAQQYEQAAALVGFNIQTELFQQLVGEYGLWVRAGSDPSQIGALFASGVEDPATVVNALSQLTLLIQGGAGGTASVTTRQVDGSQVNVINTGDSSSPRIEYGVVGQQLLVGIGSAIDDHVKGTGSTLADNEQFKAVMATLPDQHNGLLYVDLGQLIPLTQGLAATASESGLATEDASPDCANYDSQQAAQEAYDSGEEGTFDLDQDFDGEVCEDFFGSAATPESEAVAAMAGADYSAIKAFALVAYDENGARRTSSILYIEGK